MIPQIKKILYATDLSPNSGFVFRYAINSALKHDAELIIFHVVEELAPSAKALIESHLDKDKLKEITDGKFTHAKKRIQQRIKSLLEKESINDPKVERLISSIEVEEGYPADSILRRADRLNCDAIIMGTHGKGFLRHAYFGSTAKKVLRRVRIPVFIVPLPEGETDITFHD
ncbi:MAG: hypothetical protein AMJ54_14455 [Deltaproteobacteria bacterium SG8_13]|nr:MAG: hypothetical protein AMJ54_14455 [Deltaproteobacteria bacterium SG8_13]